MLSIPHMIVVFVVVLVVFGPHKLPELARGLGKLMAEFRKASTDFKSAFEEEMREMERQTRIAELKKQAAAEATAAAVEAPPARASTPETPPSQLAGELQDRIEPVIAPVAESVARASGDALEPAEQNFNSETKQAAPEPQQDLDPVHDKQQPA
jgi:sec-independent protein translocase protein TatB